METKNTRKKLIVAAALAGLVTGATVDMSDAYAKHHENGKHEKKAGGDGCNDCKHHKKAKKGDKDGCGGPNGCGEKHKKKDKKEAK